MARILKFWGSQRKITEITRIEVLGSSEDSVNGQYFPTSAEKIPLGFQKVKFEDSHQTIIFNFLVINSKYNQKILLQHFSYILFFEGLPGSGLASSENVGEAKLRQDVVQERERSLHLLEHSGLQLVDRQGEIRVMEYQNLPNIFSLTELEYLKQEL